MGSLKAQCLLFIFMLFGICAKTQFSILPSSTSCSCNGSIQYEPDPGNPGVFSLLSSSGVLLSSANEVSGIAVFADLCPSVYQLQATTPNGSFSEIVQVTSLDGSAGILGSLSICSGTAAQNLNLQVGSILPGGTWRKPNGTTFNGMYNPNIDNTGIYTYTILINGCENVTGVAVNEIQNANAGIQTTYIICDSYAAFEMFDYLEGSPDTGGQWLNSSGQPISGIYDPSTMNSGLFVYSINSVPGCPAAFNTMVIQENTTPNAGINTSIIVCQNAAPFSLFDQLEGNPMNGGFWFSPSNTPFSGTFNPAIHPPGNYRYVVTAPAPCSDQEATLNIQFVAENPSGESSTITLCSNGVEINMTDSLEGSPLPGGIWRNEAGQIVDNLYDPAIDDASTYFYYYPNVGCSPAQVPLTILEVETPEAGANATYEFCQSEIPIDLTELLVGGEPGGIFYDEFNSPIPAEFGISGTQLTTIQYRVSSTVCATDIAELTIGVVAPPETPADQSLNFCITDTPIDLDEYNTITNPFLYTNSSGNAVSSLIDLEPGESVFTITSLSGNVCENRSANITLVVDTLPFTGVDYNFDVCSDDSPFSLDQFILPEKEALGSWFNSSGAAISGTVSIGEAGTYEYVFASNVISACPVQQLELTLNVFEPYEAGPDNSVDLCFDIGTFDLSSLLETDDANGLWRSNGTEIDANLFFTIPGEFSFEYEVPSNGACAADASQHVVVIHPSIQVNAGENQEVCNGFGSLTLGADAQLGLEYQWFPSENLDNPFGATTNLIATNNSDEDVLNLEYTLTANNGICFAEDQVAITIFPTPTINAGEDQFICLGESVELFASGGSSYEWAPSLFFTDPSAIVQAISVDFDQLFTLTGQNDFGCISQDQISITVNPLPEFEVNTNSINTCPPAVLNLSAEMLTDNITSFNWQLNDIWYSSTPQLSAVLTEAGIYDLNVVGYTTFGCADTVSLQDFLTIYPNPIAAFAISPNNPSTLNNEVYFDNASVGGSNYFWTFGTGDSSEEISPSFIYSAEEAANYNACLITYSEFGCTDTVCRTISLENDYVFFAPNAFTPDNDGLNDMFQVYFEGFEESTFQMQIYDRWGGLVFTSTDPREGWLGEKNGGEYYSQDGVYSWQVQLKVDKMADYQVFQGHVTLIR